MSDKPQSKQDLRRKIKRQRSLLTQKDIALASKDLIKSARYLPTLFKAKRILSYVAVNGEICPSLLTGSIPFADVYLPRVAHYANRQMQFYKESSALRKNQFGIKEPLKSHTPLAASHFDAVLMPLVAFDRNGVRLGMGGGFYDTAFEFRLDDNKAKRPLLVGLAHHFQEVKSLTAEYWDVPLDAIITDRELISIT